MPIELTLYGTRPEDIMKDVYFQEEFVALHAHPDPIDSLKLNGFYWLSAVRQIEGTTYEDLETPWGYGGPVANNDSEFWRGVGQWRQRQTDRGRVAEFVRLHPFLNPVALRGMLDQIRFDRLTVLVNLNDSESRRRHYSKGTRYSLRQAEKKLSIRRLGKADAEEFRSCYYAGLKRNNASENYFFDTSYFSKLLEAEWVNTWAADQNGELVAVACFLSSHKFAHYHLSGGVEAARDSFAHYLLLEHAFEYFAATDIEWMHLGGGRSAKPDDTLLQFKAKFSSTLVPFYTGGLVYDRNAYDGLRHGSSERFLSYRFAAPKPVTKSILTMQPATMSNFVDYFRLKCDIVNIAWSGKYQPPNYQEMLEWFSCQLDPGSGRTILIALSEDNVIGYSYIDIHENELEVSASHSASKIQREAYADILLGTMEWIRMEMPGHLVFSWIFNSNNFQTSAFVKAGFIQDLEVSSRTAYAAATGEEDFQYRWIWSEYSKRVSAK